MERLMEFVKRKSHLEYEMNSIEKYIHGGDFDNNLKTEWSNMEEELKVVEREIRLLSNSETKELELQKLQLLDEIRSHEEDIKKLKLQVNLHE
jgi:uncharacterized protein YdcH (DUF465 family)